MELLKNSPLSSISSEFSNYKLVSAFGVVTRSGPYTYDSCHLCKGTEHATYLLKFKNVKHISEKIWLAHAIFLLPTVGGCSYLHSCKFGTKLGESGSHDSKVEGEE
jgi:hypothetical protein